MTKGTEVSHERLCQTARRLQSEIAKCLKFMRESRVSIESGRLPMFANTHQNWCAAEEALQTVWVNLHYDSIPEGVCRSDLRTAWGVLERPKQKSDEPKRDEKGPFGPSGD